MYIALISKLQEAPELRRKEMTKSHTEMKTGQHLDRTEFLNKTKSAANVLEKKKKSKTKENSDKAWNSSAQDDFVKV